MNVTPTLNLHKPDINGEDTENVWGYDLNTNFDLIDAAFAGLAGDKGDIIVSNGSLNFDPNIVTAAARSVIAGPTITAMRTTLGAEAAIPVGTPAQFWRGDKSWQTLGITDVPTLQPALDLKAPLASPVFTGNPTAPTPIPGDNDTSLATTAFVTAAMVAVGNIVPNNAIPRMDGVAAPGTSPLYMRADHVHPSDTSRVAKTGDVMSGPLSGITTLTVAGNAGVGGNLNVAGTSQTDILTTIRASDPGQGTVLFGNSGAKFIHYDGTNFNSSARWLFGNQAIAGITTITTSGAASFGGAGSFGANAGIIQVTAQGGNSANGDGANFGVFNGGVLTCAFGNKSAIVGGVFTYQPFLYTNNAGLEIDSTLTVHASLTVLGSDCGIELGTPSVVNTPFIDFHSSGTSNDCDVRIISSGGAVTAGRGTLTIQSANVSVTQLLVAEAVNTYNGKLEIQTNNYTYGLFINNSGTADIVAAQFGYGGAGVGAIVCSSVATAYSTTSDGDLKEDLHAFDSGSFFDRVKVYEFAWKNGAGRGVGCVAQELYEIEPNAVVPGETRTFPATEEAPEREVAMPWGADYSKLVPHLIAEVQALRARVAHLEAA